MKKYAAIITLLLILTLFTPAAANSGPVYWQGYPAAEMMTIEKETPLIVESEELVFDFSQQYTPTYNLAGKVTATYQMSNPTAEQQAVQMAFPFCGRLQMLDAAEIVIKVDAHELPFELYLGSRLDFADSGAAAAPSNSLTFQDILSAVSRQQYDADNFSAGEVGRLYRFMLSPTTEQNINFAVSFSYHAEEISILCHGFNGFEREGEKVRLTSWCAEPMQAAIFVLGGELDFTVQAYTDGELTDSTDLYTAEITVEAQQVKPYLLTLSRQQPGTTAITLLDETQVYNLYAEALDRQFTYNLGYCAAEELWAQAEQERMLVLLYTVEFPPQSVREVSVSYVTSGTMDKRETVSPQYSFTYLLKPAAHWRHFKNLQIRIITPPETPYVVNSSLPLKQTAEREYSAEFTALPADDLYFTLYAKEKITAADKAAVKIKRIFAYFPLSVLGLLLLSIMLRRIFTVKSNTGSRKY